MINKLNFPFRIMMLVATVLMLQACQKDLDIQNSEQEEQISITAEASVEMQEVIQSILATRSNPDGVTSAQQGLESRMDLTIAKYISFKPELSMLLQAINRFPGLLDALDDPSIQITAFIPNNDAFNNLFDNSEFNSLEEVPDNVLGSLLSQHILPGFKGIPELDMYEETFLMAPFDGGVPVNIYIQKFGNNAAVINDRAAVTRANQFVGRSIVHFISQVYPLSNLGVLIDDNPNFTIFNAAVERDDLDRDLIEAMMSGGPFTVLVPTDAAFMAAFEELGIASQDELSGSQISRLLWSHVIEGNYRADELAAGITIASAIEGNSITTNFVNGRVRVMGDDGTASVVRINIQGTNGVAHAIDALIAFGDGNGDNGGDDDEPATLYVSSNTSGTIAIYNADPSGLINGMQINVPNMDADGIYYDEDDDILYQLDRTNNRINAYANASSLDPNDDMTPTFTSSSDFVNGREIAVSGDRLVVAQDASDGNGMMNKFYIYNLAPNAIMLDKVYDAPINLWGIHLEGETMYAIEDNSSNLAIFEDFFSRSEGMIIPTGSLEIEGIVRTHGLTYDDDNDIMILTDVGDGGSATDGAFHIIENFSTKASAAFLADNASTGIIPMSDQIRVAGSNTSLGNPVDVAFDEELGMIHIAERANNGGRILTFAYPTDGGNIAPFSNIIFGGASAVYLAK